MASNQKQQYVAVRELSIQGKLYKRGDLVDTSKLPDHKIAQFLDQRRIKFKS